MSTVASDSAKFARIFRKQILHFVGAIVGIFLLSLQLFAQANQGRIMGTVFDQSGAVIAGATVTVTDVQRGVSRTLTTDGAGAYNAPDLSPGTYLVRAEAKGFKTTQRENIGLEVGSEVRIDLKLQTGEQTQTITVTEQVPLVETSSTTLGGTLSNNTINQLPLNGRDYINLLALRPGVTLYPGGGSSTRSANGARSEDIGYLLDGVRVDEAYSGQSVLNAPIPAGDASTSLPLDAIQEFNTEENPKAEFGWKPGAIVNAGIKSGTNSIHGTAFAFGRDTALDARNYFDAAPTPKAPISLEQFGASVGGPIKKDHLFYFLNYEGQRYSVGSTFSTTTPATVSLGGDPANSLVDACNAVGRANVTPLSAQIAGLPAGSCIPRPTNYTPGPNESLFPTNNGANGTAVLLGLLSNNHQDDGVAKIDYNINEHHSLSGTYFFGEGGGIWNDGGYQVGVPGSSNSPWMSNVSGHIQVGTVGWTWTPNSTVVNEMHVGFNRFYQPYLSVDSNVNPLAYGINTGITDPRFFGFPFIRFVGFGMRLGGNWPKITGPDDSLQFMDHVSIQHGNHSFKFGGELINNSVTAFITANGKSTMRFGPNSGSAKGPDNTSLENFLLGDVRNKGFVSQILVGDPLRHLSDQQYAAFVQDDWRIKPRLTLNLGVRYELTTVLKDRNNQLGNFDPVAGLVQVGYGLNSIYNGDHNNFSPRVGLAWDVNGNGKTVVRAGGNIMYEQLPIDVFIAVANQLGLNQVPTGATTVVNGVSTPGRGNMGVLTTSVNGNLLAPGWQAQTAGCVSGGTTACGSIFPAQTFQLTCGDGSIPAGGNTPTSQCNTEAVDPNLRTPYIVEWTLDVQRAITNNFSLEVGYVGTHSTKLLGFRDINQPPIGACPTADPVCEQQNRPYNSRFPYLAQIDQLSNYQKANYNALQVTATQRASHGLSFILGYTYAHSLDMSASNWNANTLPPDSYNPYYMYASSDFDRRHVFTFSTVYDLPGRQAPLQLLEGWEVNSIVTLMSGAPWSVQDTSNDFPGNGQINELDSFGQPWNFFGNPNDFTSGPTPIPFYQSNFPAACTAHAALADLNSYGCYMKGNSVLVPPAQGTIGTMGRNIFRDSGFRNWDLSIVKSFKFKERLTAQFRSEFFNILNHPNFANPFGPAGLALNDPSAGQFGCGCATPDQAAPNPVLGSGGSRSIQFGLKLIF